MNYQILFSEANYSPVNTTAINLFHTADFEIRLVIRMFIYIDNRKQEYMCSLGFFRVRGSVDMAGQLAYWLWSR